MKLKDLKDKRILWSCDLGDMYYWNEKLIVEIDEDYVCLLNYDDSFSGYYEYSLESIDKGFISAFFDLPAGYSFCKEENATLNDYIKDYTPNDDVVLIKKRRDITLFKIIYSFFMFYCVCYLCATCVLRIEIRGVFKVS